ncbi:MAG: helix-hairpin-helix domain-containing protein [Clostridia bacterium]|nr:helix-hairpin-helix domain-containing protein [Clostridia bacterium]
MPRSVKTEQQKARRKNAARLAVFFALIFCAGIFLFEGVEYILSFRRASVALTASNENMTRFLSNGAEGKMDVNRADAADFQAVPGIGPELSQRIIALREERGGFSFLEEVTDVSGIGDKRFDALEDYFFCPLPDAFHSPAF